MTGFPWQPRVPAQAGDTVDVVCAVHAGLDLYHFSKILTGVWLLAERREIHARFVGIGEPSLASGFAPAITTLTISTGAEHRVGVVDLSDRSDVFVPVLLETCDLYFKRSFHAPDVDSLPADLARRVVPFGLNYACRARGPTISALRAVGPALALRLVRSAGRLDLSRELHALRFALVQFLGSPDFRAFECEPASPVDRTILYQPRVWEQEHVTEEVEAINDARAQLVRALRREFPSHYHGGLIDTPFARARYPDAITRQSSRRSVYVTAGLRALIGVTTRGLHHSLPFKLPEYLAGSKCVVTEALRNQLPEPLRSGSQYVEFASTDDCLGHCAELLRRSELADHLRSEAWGYYRRQVEPAAHARLVLTRLLGRSLAPSSPRSPRAE